MQYLVDWSFALCGRSGSSLEGPAPLSYPTIEAWSRLCDVRLAPWEVEALIALDDAIRLPEEPETEPDMEHPRERPAWPTRKRE